jgi:hypothetical protein
MKAEFVKNNMKIYQCITLLALLLFVSCTKCEDCEFNGNTERLCEQDFDSPDQYQAAINAQEASGADCIAVL